jgi:hypothetical protein
MHDRRGWTPDLPVIEVMTVNPDRCQAEIVRMRDVTAGEDTIRRLDGCVASLVQTHASKVALTAAPQLICMRYALHSLRVRDEAS